MFTEKYHVRPERLDTVLSLCVWKPFSMSALDYRHILAESSLTTT